MNKLLFSVVGKPNSGKDTLMFDLSAHYNGKHNLEIISVSKLIRTIDHNSALWRDIEKVFNSGQFIPQHIVNELLVSAIQKSKSDLVFLNSATTTMAQSEIFDSSGILPLSALILLSATDDFCKARAEKRIVCEKCRKPYQIEQKLSTCLVCGGTLVRRIDDTNLQKRFIEYQENTIPVIEHFKKHKIMMLDIPINENSTQQKTCEKATEFFKTNFGL